MTRKHLTLLFALVLCLTASLPVKSQSDDGYDLTWFTIDGGGAMFSLGSSFSLGSTVGQADAGTLTGGGYTLVGGFWHGVVALNQYTYLPLVLRNF